MAAKTKQDVPWSVVDALRNAYKHRANVSGCDVGYVWDGDRQTKAVSLRIHVAPKRPLDELPPLQVMPKVFRGYQLDVIDGPYKIPEISQSIMPSQSANILTGGISCGRADGGNGTLGAIVIEESTGRPAILSNWHVLAGRNRKRGDAILQPGRQGQGLLAARPIAHLERFVLGEKGDAAVAILNGNRAWSPVQGDQAIELSGVAPARLGQTLCKFGNATHMTTARVDGIGTYRVAYEISPGRFERRWINGCKLVPLRRDIPLDAEISAVGDSGACWFDPHRKAAVGLHFAGETNQAPGHEFALACDMQTVISALGVRLALRSDTLQHP